MSLTKPSKHREGKTLEAPGQVKKCDGCDADNGIIYCGQCRFVYCAPCQKAHSRNAFTKDHKVQRISDISTSNIEAKMRSLHLGICPKHIGSAASYACLACTTVFCDDCKGSHAGHEIKPCVDDDKVVQKICRAQTQSLYDALSFLENVKECIIKRNPPQPGVFAGLSVQETVKLCINTLTELGRHAEEEIDKSDKELEKPEKEVVDFMQKVGDKISKLTSVRNVNDVGVLLPEAAKTAAILDEYDVTKDLFSRFGATEKDISDILPNIGGVENLISAMGTLLELQTDTYQTCDIALGTEYEYKAMNTLEKIIIKDTYTSYHKICDAVTENEIVVHGLGMMHIRLFDIKLGTMKNMKMDFGIWNMVKPSAGAYIITQMHTQHVHLLDAKMQIKDTMKAPNSSPNLICYYSRNSIVYLTTKAKKNPIIALINLVHIAHEKFSNVQFITDLEVKEYPQAMFLNDKNSLTIATKSHLYKVNLKDASHIVNDLPSQISAVAKSLYIDAKGYHIICDYDGNLHVVDKAMGHHFTKTIKKEDPIWGLTMKGDILYATCSGYIHKFKIPRK